MTGRGIGAAVTLVLVLLIGLGTGLRDVYFIVFVLDILLLYACLSALLAACTLRCVQTLDADKAVRGESATLRVRMVRFLPLPAVVRLWVKLPVPSALPSEGQFHFALMPGGKRPDLSLRVYCPHRGVWSVRVDKVRVHDIFGLFSFPLLGKQALNNRELALTVYPQLYELTGEPLSPAILAEDSTAKAVVTDHGDSFSGTRQYRDGDSLKRIHWKQSIRTQELYTRQYEMSTEQYNLLVMDTGAPAGVDIPGYADMAAECAGTLALFYLSEGQPVEIWGEGPDSVQLTGRSPDDFAEIYTLLAELPFQADPLPLDLSSLLDANLGAVRSVHVLTNRPTPELLETLRLLAGRRCLVSCLCPDFPYARQLRASCPEDVHLYLITSPADILAQMGESL